MLNVVILAAGLGKRMQSDLPKVLHTLAGRPMLEHVLDSARALDPARIVVVVGHGADRVKTAFKGQDDLSFALQQPQHGTGHAVAQLMQAMPQVPDDALVLVLYGDVPLLEPQTLRQLIEGAPSSAWAEAFRGHLQALTDLTAQITALRDSNLQYLRAEGGELYETLARLDAESGTYDASGEASSAPATARLFESDL